MRNMVIINDCKIECVTERLGAGRSCVLRPVF